MTTFTEDGIRARRLPFIVATFFGTGLSPLAPGTAGSIAALPLAWVLLQMPLLTAAMGVAFLFALGLWSANHLEQVSGQHDAQIIVIDEVVGVCVSTLILGWWLRAAVDPYLLLLLAFVSFRLFDIVKPWPVGWLDRAIGGGLGVMIDDIAAAIMGALCVLGFYYAALVASI